MGLFSNRSGKKGKRGGKPKRSWLRAKPAKQHGDMERGGSGWMRSVLSVMLLPVVMAAIVAGLWYGQRALGEQIGRSKATVPTVVLHDVPGWMGTDRADSIRRVVAAQVSTDPMDQRSLAAAVAALSENPWIESVTRIERSRTDRVEVFVVYRTPIALVGARDGYHLVDRNGHRLPGVYPYHQLESLGLPAITGAAYAPPREGETWRGDDLAAGLKLVSTVVAQPWSRQVRGVDVANFGGRADRTLPHLLLLTDRGVVRWGRAPGDERVYEPTAERKLAMLRRVADSYGGRIDAGGGVVDVYTDTPLIHPASALRQTNLGE